MSCAVFKNISLVLPGVYSFYVLYTFSANLRCVMLIVVVAGRRHQTNTTVLYLPLLLFIIQIFETLKHVVLLLLLLNLFKSENCLITTPMLVKRKNWL